MFREKRSIGDRFKRIKEVFLILFERDQLEPLQLNLSPPKVKASHLYTIEHSRALQNAISSWFRKSLDTRMLIIIFLVVGMVGIFLLSYMGYIDFGGLLK